MTGFFPAAPSRRTRSVSSPATCRSVSIGASSLTVVRGSHAFSGPGVPLNSSPRQTPSGTRNRMCPAVILVGMSRGAVAGR